MSPTALIVDDEPHMTVIVEFALQTQGFTAVVAHDGATAMHLLRSRSIDLVVLDVMMPTMDGLALCQRIRARSDVPIMLLTALNQHDDVIAGLEHGADDYMTKPFHPRELALRAQALVRRRRDGPTAVMIVGELRIDPTSQSAVLAGCRARPAVHRVQAPRPFGGAARHATVLAGAAARGVGHRRPGRRPRRGEVDDLPVAVAPRRGRRRRGVRANPARHRLPDARSATSRATPPSNRAAPGDVGNGASPTITPLSPRQHPHGSSVCRQNIASASCRRSEEVNRWFPISAVTSASRWCSLRCRCSRPPAALATRSRSPQTRQPTPVR